MESLLGPQLFYLVFERFDIEDVREVRLRLGAPLHVKTTFGDFFLSHAVTEENIEKIVATATNNSRYAFEDEISSGYVAYKKGVRIGIVGNGNKVSDGKLSYKKIHSLCIRIPHEIFTYPSELDACLVDFESTLVLSPPGCGKTTLVREMARRLADGFDTLIVDERYELCGGGLGMRIGKRADVLQGMPKTAAYENIIRTMAPEIVVFDELFGERDALAVKKIINSGVKCLATYHAESSSDVPDDILSAFVNIITLNSKPKVGNILSIIRKT